MMVQAVRKTLYTLVGGMGVIYLAIGAATRFSAEALTLDMVAFIRVTGPLLIGLVCAAGLIEALTLE